MLLVGGDTRAERAISAPARAVGRNGDVERDMALGRCAEAQEGLFQCGEDRPGIAREPGAEILRSVEDAGTLEEVDAAVDLVHVLRMAERIVRELRGYGDAGGHGAVHLPPGQRNPRVDRPV